MRQTRRNLLFSALVLPFAGCVAGCSEEARADAAPPPPKAKKSKPPAKKTEPKQRVIYIQPMGSALPQKDFEFVKTAMAAYYDFEIKILARVPLPKSAYYAKRKRYRAEKLLKFLATRMPDDGFRILGLTAHDISTTKGKHEDWGILGLGSISGETCVVSSFRCKRGAKSKEHARIRLGKIVVHELGHTFGLPHCPTKGCLMRDGAGTVKTLDGEFDLCTDLCRPRLARGGIGLASAPAPWPDPNAPPSKG